MRCVPMFRVQLRPWRGDENCENLLLTLLPHRFTDLMGTLKRIFILFYVTHWLFATLHPHVIAIIILLSFACLFFSSVNNLLTASSLELKSERRNVCERPAVSSKLLSERLRDTCFRCFTVFAKSVDEF